jgi:uncharacterized membrane protein
MGESDRIDRLEARIASLEAMVSGLAKEQRGGGAAGKQPQTSPIASSGLHVPRPVASPPLRRPVAPPTDSPLNPEQWIGQRLLLAIGVVALILAAGYLLRLSFDRGWISPVMRCVGGTCAGAIVGAIGWRLQPRYRTYGAALIGCGAAIIYLSVWAAARLYGVLPPTTGILGLALVSIALAMIAYAVNVEALGTTAALGAFFAPLLLGRDRSHPDLLLLYLACMAAGLGFVAARRRWRLTMFVVALSYFGIAYTGAADRGTGWAVLLYGVVGGSAGLHLGLRERWWETRLLSFAGGWTFVAAANETLHHPWATLVAGVVLAVPVWWYGLHAPWSLPDQLRTRAAPGWSLGEIVYFFLTPVLLGWAVYQLDPRWFAARPGAVALVVALPYLVAGYQRTRPAFALIGAAAAGIAAWEHWNGVDRVWALLGLTLLWATLDHLRGRDDGRWFALATLFAGLDHLVSGALEGRAATDPSFVGTWALCLWGSVAVTLGLAAGLWRREGQPDTQVVTGALWALAGVMVLFGVTGEIQRYFEMRGLALESARLASGLAVSAWWLLFAATLVGLGFRRSLKPARIAGLCVAGLAVVKVLVFDLSSLDALYRVGSVFILGTVFLLLAYLYHRQGRVAGVERRESAT